MPEYAPSRLPGTSKYGGIAKEPVKGKDTEKDRMTRAIYHDAGETRARHAHGRKPEFPEYQDIVEDNIESRLRPHDKGDDSAPVHANEGIDESQRSKCREDRPQVIVHVMAGHAREVGALSGQKEDGFQVP